ncbi:TonB-dependent receptor [Mucilaginibacter conchicola]|uniref:TonB-dependent receptor n=1 Tax=Mucilaginibacter conchicola TaxID=2303333 RepID=A0A372NX12_9SPHI|nr:TonB-dependent receptor [Mucilaginibacter conchicola]RFZ94653.1 TonB-dependent receptor [Mucilaginibacter conchicola]
MKQVYFDVNLATKRPPGQRIGLRYLLLLLFLMCSSVAWSQSKITITGSVTDTLGTRLPGASVVVINSKNIATSTDENGKFVLDVAPGAILRISFVGFVAQQINVTASTKVVNVKLQEQKLQTDEIVITAFGKKERKEALVGSVTSVKPAELKIPASNLTTALAGQAAGVIAYTPSGQPGQDNAKFFIRGVTTFGYKQDPLILIDNVEYGANDLARLNVDDIASFSILKDASATALYGARGANGVILISTKEGKDGTTKLSFRSEYSMSQSTQTLDLVDPIRYMELYNEASLTRDPRLPLPFTPTDINGARDTYNKAPGANPYLYPAVDWLGLLFKKTAVTQRNNLNISGGNQRTRYYIAGAYNIDHGVLREDIRNNNNNNVNFKTYQLRSNININATKTTEIVVRLSGLFNEYNGPMTTDGSFASDLYNVAIHTSPVLFPAYFEPDAANANAQHILFGNVATATSSNDNSVLYNNPYANLLRGHKNSSESRMSAQLELNQDLRFVTQGLKFRSIFNTNRYSYFQTQMAYNPFYYSVDKTSPDYKLIWINNQPAASGRTGATEYLQYNRDQPNNNSFMYLQTAIDYNRAFGDHNISSTLIGTAQQTLYSSAQDPRTKGYTLPYALPFRNLGLAGRATYSYKSKYFAEFNFGYNGSERFSAEHRYGFFPTIGGSWVISNESFWNPAVIDRLKIRASYGLVGNDAIGEQRFFYQSDVGLNEGGNYAQFGMNNQYERKGVIIRNYANPNVVWETSRQTNIAIEATLFKNFNIIAEFYRNHRYNILQSLDNGRIPSTEGLEVNTSANLGQVDSKGIDLSLDYKQNFSNGAWASMRGNFTYSTNRYKYLLEPNYAETWRKFVGQPISRGYGYIAERLFVDDQEARNSPTQIFSNNNSVGAPKGGDIKYRDLNNDGKIDYLDMAFIGYPTTPEIVYGFGFSTGYKGFDLSAFFQGQARVSFFINPNKVSPFIPSDEPGIYGNTQVLTEFANSHWSEENQDLYALYPRLGTTRATVENNLQPSTWWLRDGSFLRLKSVELGYTLPARLTKSIRMSNLRIYTNGFNLLTWSPFKMWDPELGGNGFAYPIQKVFNLGVNATF